MNASQIVLFFFIVVIYNSDVTSVKPVYCGFNWCCKILRLSILKAKAIVLVTGVKQDEVFARTAGRRAVTASAAPPPGAPHPAPRALAGRGQCTLLMSHESRVFITSTS